MSIALMGSMPRAKLFYTDRFPYHAVARTNNREIFPLALDDCWLIFQMLLNRISEKYNANWLTFVLMSNHFHMLIQTPNNNLGEIMNYLMRESSKLIGRGSGRENHIFGGSYKGTLVDNQIYFSHVYRYVYRNPVVAGICNRVEVYAFSSIHNEPEPTENWVKKGKIIPLSLESRLEWLNTPYKTKEAELIRKGLERKKFSLSKSNNFKNERLSLSLM